MKTTLEMPDELFRRAKAAAARRGQSLKEMITTALERELVNPATGIRKTRRQQIQVETSLQELERISVEIGAAWQGDVSAVDAIREQRREL